MSIDVEALLKPISDDDPCGPDPSYDPAFAILESLLQVNDSQFSESEEPNWTDIRKASIAILEKSKDLTTAVYLSIALLKQEGFTGFRDSLSLVHGLLDRFWDHVHPQLDPDDNNDPLERINILSNLAAPMGTFGDPFKFIQRIQEVPICSSRQLGSFSLREILIAKGKITLTDTTDENPPDMKIIEAAFKDADSEEIEATLAAVNEAIELVTKIDGVVSERAEGGSTLNLSNLQETLANVLKFSKMDQAEGEEEGDISGEETPSDSESPVKAKSISGEINSTQDVEKALEKIIDFYERNEPSSPIPLLVKRTQKMVGMNFRQLIDEVASNAQAQVNELFGPPEAEG